METKKEEKQPLSPFVKDIDTLIGIHEAMHGRPYDPEQRRKDWEATQESTKESKEE